MSKITVSNLFIYPVKSTQAVPLMTTQIEQMGLQNDRIFAVVDEHDNIVTGRENPNLLSITCTLKDKRLRLTLDKGSEFILDLEHLNLKEISAVVFNNEVNGLVLENGVNDWISNSIGQPARIIQLNLDKLRTVKEKHNGRVGDVFAFDDAAPVNLMSEESLGQLNNVLTNPVSAMNFRPNIVIKGAKAFAEDNWRCLKIGDCEFEKAKDTARCSFLNINPKTYERDGNQEPLRTLTKIRRKDKKVIFGIYLIPRKLGQISVGDEVNVTS